MTISKRLRAVLGLAAFAFAVAAPVTFSATGGFGPSFALAKHGKDDKRPDDRGGRGEPQPGDDRGGR